MSSHDIQAGAGRAAHDLALASLIGGNLFGRLAMHPALTDVSDATERGRVLNRAWRRYGTINSLALVTLVAGWLPERRHKAHSRFRTRTERTLTTAQDIALGAVVVTGLASAASGVGFAQQAPGGAVPMESGTEAAPEAPPRAAKLKHLLNALGALHLGACIGLLGVNAVLDQRPRLRQPY